MSKGEENANISLNSFLYSLVVFVLLIKDTYKIKNIGVVSAIGMFIYIIQAPITMNIKKSLLFLIQHSLSLEINSL